MTFYEMLLLLWTFTELLGRWSIMNTAYVCVHDERMCASMSKYVDFSRRHSVELTSSNVLSSSPPNSLLDTIMLSPRKLHFGVHSVEWVLQNAAISTSQLIQTNGCYGIESNDSRNIHSHTANSTQNN